jgi:D-alanyl-lipoteichoic acid acyltransferase DltB (MBOAT superfamily)
MSFNSLPFLLFFVAVFTLYWFAFREKTKAQNAFLLIASWFFYGYASLKMLPLLIGATAAFYGLGIWMKHCRSEKGASWIGTLGVVLGVGLLLAFKYLNFFIESFAALFQAMGLQTNWHTFNIILPLGLSFITFKLISYVLEIRRGKIEAETDFVAFAAYIAFFPCLLSGPIDRPQFLGQLHKTRVFDYDTAAEGMRQFLWGLAKKVLIADRCVYVIDPVWENIGEASGSSLLMAALLYTFQMYTDFSGYSDMAIGTGKLLGFRIAKNFNYPFFATNVAEYWRRWHMSLTSWLTDYVFMPLNVRFRDWGKAGMILAIVINMVLVGLWHGANWTFGAFGLYHGLLFIPLILSGAFVKKHKLKAGRLGLPKLSDLGGMVLTFLLVTVGLVIFRADSVGQAWQFLSGMAHLETLKGFYLFFLHPDFRTKTVLIIVLMFLEWRNRTVEFPLVPLKAYHWAVRYAIYLALVCLLVMLWDKNLTFLYIDF